MEGATRHKITQKTTPCGLDATKSGLECKSGIQAGFVASKLWRTVEVQDAFTNASKVKCSHGTHFSRLQRIWGTLGWGPGLPKFREGGHHAKIDVLCGVGGGGGART